MNGTTHYPGERTPKNLLGTAERNCLFLKALAAATIGAQKEMSLLSSSRNLSRSVTRDGRVLVFGDVPFVLDMNHHALPELSG